MNLRNLARRVKRIAKSQSRPILRAASVTTVKYADRLQAEKASFSGCQSHNDLPDIYSYWSNKHLRPKLESLGYATPEEMFCHHFERAYKSGQSLHKAFVSLGSGSCATEIRIAQFLLERNCREFTIECFELNEELLAEGRALAASAGVDAFVHPIRGDFNAWSPDKDYDGILANNSLHHMVNLEGLFDGIQKSLLPTGTFVTSDMIGRNGHMRWPEALAIVHEFWRELPKKHTYNHLLKRYEKLYENWDCSSGGFEGIRAQDILPLLIAYFEFDVFVPFANVVDPFVDRPFGPNFDQDNPADCAFIDRVHARDHAEIAGGAIKPTHIVAAMCSGRAGLQQYVDGLTPSFSVRSPVRAPIMTHQAPADIAPDAADVDEVDDAVNAADAGGSPRPLHDYSDLWWNPLESGWGLSIHQHPNFVLVAAWLVYRPDRSPIWYSLQPGGWKDATTFESIVYEGNAPPPGFQNPGDRPAASLRRVGSATLAFADRSNGVFSYSIEGNTGSSNICRMEY